MAPRRFGTRPPPRLKRRCGCSNNRRRGCPVPPALFFSPGAQAKAGKSQQLGGWAERLAARRRQVHLHHLRTWAKAGVFQFKVHLRALQLQTGVDKPGIGKPVTKGKAHRFVGGEPVAVAQINALGKRPSRRALSKGSRNSSRSAARPWSGRRSSARCQGLGRKPGRSGGYSCLPGAPKKGGSRFPCEERVLREPLATLEKGGPLHVRPRRGQRGKTSGSGQTPPAKAPACARDQCSRRRP